MLFEIVVVTLKFMHQKKKKKSIVILKKVLITIRYEMKPDLSYEPDGFYLFVSEKYNVNYLIYVLFTQKCGYE